MTEQLALQKGVRDGRAIDHDQRSTRPLAVLIEVPRHQFLARAGFTPDQDADRPGGHQANGFVHLHHGATPADDRILAGFDLLEFHRHGHEPLDLNGLLDQVQKLQWLKGLNEIFVGTQFRGLDGDLRRVMGRHQYDRKMWVGRVQGFDDIQAAGASHPQIGDNNVKIFLPGSHQPLLGPVGRLNRITRDFKGALQRRSEGFIIFHQENFWVCTHGSPDIL